MGYDIFWFLIICAEVVFYVVLDGFDLGVGALHLTTKGDKERRILLNAIGPVWDGNEVWLVVIGGSLFAAFSPVYATLCSAFYTPLMIFLAVLIFRAVAIEFRSKIESDRWKAIWDTVFSISSILIVFLLGVVLGNLVSGIPIDKNGDFGGNFWTFITPYSVLTGLTALALCTMHGAIFLLMKTEGSLYKRIRKLVNPAIIVFVIFYLFLTFYTILYRPHMLHHLQNRPWLFIIAIIAVLAIANIPREINKGNNGLAFISSIVSIAALMGLFGIGMYPTMIRSSIDPANFSLTVANSIAYPETLKVITIVACIGIPLVIAYGWWVYRIFKGKVRLDESSY